MCKQKIIHISKLTVFPVLVVTCVIVYVLYLIPDIIKRDKQITDNAESARKLRTGERILNETDTALFLWDADGKVIAVTEKVLADLELSRQEVEGRSYSWVMEQVQKAGLLTIVSTKSGIGGVAIMTKPSIIQR